MNEIKEKMFKQALRYLPQDGKIENCSTLSTIFLIPYLRKISSSSMVIESVIYNDDLIKIIMVNGSIFYLDYNDVYKHYVVFNRDRKINEISNG